MNEVARRLDRNRPAKVLVFAVIAGLLGWWGVRGTLPAVEREYVKRAARLGSVDLITDAVPAGSVVFGHRTLLLALDFSQAYTLYPSVILDRHRIGESVANPDKPFAMELQKERVELLESTFSGLDGPAYTSTVRSFLGTCLSGSCGVYVAGNPSLINRSLQSLPAGYGSEVIAQERWVIPAPKLRFIRKLTWGSRSEAPRPREVSCAIVRITQVR